MDELQIIKTMITTGQFQKCPECGGTDIRSDTCRRCGYIFSRRCEVVDQKPKKKGNEILLNSGVKTTGSAPNKIRIYSICGGLFILLAGILFGVIIPVENDKKAISTGRFSHPIQKPLNNGETLFISAMRAIARKDIFTASQDFKTALGLFSPDSHEKALLLTNLNLGICYRILGKNLEALSHLERAIDISRTNGFEIYEAKAHREKGVVYNLMAQPVQAISFIEKALHIHQGLGEKEEAIKDLLILASLTEKNNISWGQEHIRHAKDLSIKLGKPESEHEIREAINTWKNGEYKELLLKYSSPDFENL